jgi:hypothetical protein
MNEPILCSQYNAAKLIFDVPIMMIMHGNPKFLAQIFAENPHNIPFGTQYIEWAAV